MVKIEIFNTLSNCKGEIMSVSNVKTKILNELPAHIDYLLVHASFEERCLSLHENLDPSQVSNLGVFYLKQFAESSGRHIDLYTQKFNATVFEMDYSHPITIADALIDFLPIDLGAKKKPNVVVDISTFTREGLLITLGYINSIKRYLGDVYVFYRAASVSNVLSEGVVQIRSVLGYMGDIDPNRPLHLVVLSGFEYERAKEMIDTLEPDFISIGIGSEDGSITDDLYKKNVEFSHKLIAYYSKDNVATFGHSLRNPYDTKLAVEKVILEKPDHNSVVVPLNNKLSTLGVGLATLSNPGIQISYSQMSSYNEYSYSTPLDEAYIYKLDF